MDKIANLALIAQMLDSAEKSLQSAKHLLRETLGTSGLPVSSKPTLSTGAVLTPAGTGVGKIVEGEFDGQNMIGPDGKQYPVPANYASKSKLVEGDTLKLTIADDGSFIYKQIGPTERRKILGILVQDERGDYRVIAEGKPYRVLLASLTYFKADLGDEVALEIPLDRDSNWGAVVNVIKKDGSSTGLYTPPVSLSETEDEYETSQENEDSTAGLPASPVAPEEEEL